VLFYTTIKEF